MGKVLDVIIKIIIIIIVVLLDWDVVVFVVPKSNFQNTTRRKHVYTFLVTQNMGIFSIFCLTTAYNSPTSQLLNELLFIGLTKRMNPEYSSNTRLVCCKQTPLAKFNNETQLNMRYLIGWYCRNELIRNLIKTRPHWMLLLFVQIRNWCCCQTRFNCKLQRAWVCFWNFMWKILHHSDSNRIFVTFFRLNARLSHSIPSCNYLFLYFGSIFGWLCQSTFGIRSTIFSRKDKILFNWIN